MGFKSYFVVILIFAWASPFNPAEAASIPAYSSPSIPSAPSAAMPAFELGPSAETFYSRPAAGAFTQPRIVDKRFLFFSTISTASLFADSYTTTWIGNNYRARGPGPCTLEGGEPSLYGIHPTIARSYAIATVMSGGAIAVSYIAKRYLPPRLKWIWPAAFIYETGVSVHGFTTNLARC